MRRRRGKRRAEERGRDVLKEVREPGGAGVSPAGLSTLTPPTCSARTC